MPLIKGNDDIQRNTETYEQLKQNYISLGYLEYSCVRKGLKHDLLSAAAGLPAFVIVPVYAHIVGDMPTLEIKQFLICIILLFITTPLHELLHAFGWIIFSKNNSTNIFIYLPLGISDAYCHCNGPLNFFEYLAGSVFPFFFLSIVPAVVSIFIRSSTMLYFSVFSAFSCGSDIINSVIVCFHRDEIILDYPTDCGFTSYKKLNH